MRYYCQRVQMMSESFQQSVFLFFTASFTYIYIPVRLFSLNVLKKKYKQLRFVNERPRAITHLLASAQQYSNDTIHSFHKKHEHYYASRLHVFSLHPITGHLISRLSSPVTAAAIVKFIHLCRL